MTSNLIEGEWTGAQAPKTGPAPKVPLLASSGLIFLGALAPSGTTSSALLQDSPLGIYAPGQTDYGFVASTTSPSPSSTAADLSQLRRRTGLPMSQLASLFGATRRSLHNWIIGRPMSPHKAETLRAMLSATQQLAHNLSSHNRQILLSADRQGISIFDHLREGRFDSAKALINAAHSVTRQYKQPPKLSAAERRNMRGPSIREQLQGLEGQSRSNQS